jgi:TonB family protein
LNLKTIFIALPFLLSINITSALGSNDKDNNIVLGTTDQTKDIQNNDVVSQYGKIISEKIYNNLVVPPPVVLGNFEPTKVIVFFTLRPNGSVETLKIDRASDPSVLDEYAIEAVSGSAPFPNFPKEISSSSLSFKLPIVYHPFESDLDPENTLDTRIQKKSTQNDDYFRRYLEIIRNKIYNNWENPLPILLLGLKKPIDIIISFNLHPKGGLESLIINKPSSLPVLNENTIKAVSDSAPFPIFPKELSNSNLNLTIRFIYWERTKKLYLKQINDSGSWQDDWQELD